MKLWRLTRADHSSLDGKGAMIYGGRYSSPGRPIVNFASEAGLAVLIALRYLQPTPEAMLEEYRLGWTSTEAEPVRVPDMLDDNGKKKFVDEWSKAGNSLLAAVRSAVLPEADVILMNPLHPDAAAISSLTSRPFRFSECLHRPPMLGFYG